MAPLAPTMGTRESGSASICAKRRRHAAQQVKQQELAVAQDVFHVVAEDPQEQHVPHHVQPAGVQEHGGEDVRQVEMGRRAGCRPLMNRCSE